VSLRYILTIAGQTFTEARRNKVFYSIFLFALVVVLNSYLFTEVTITTMDRVLKDTGMAAINIFALALTVFTGVGVINREIDRKSIFSVIAKPIARYQFIVGKYVGLLAMMLATCGIMFLCLLVVMVGYRTPIHSSAFVGFYGIFLEVAVLGAFAVLCSSFTSSFVSAFMTVAIFVSGHLSSELRFFATKSPSPAVKAVGNAIYYAVPNLERFNFKYHVTYDVAVEAGTLLLTTSYALAYVVAFLVASVVIFSQRDFR
jgi:ABC-type transport system involved in multi-copper enzyme maturation permease subunit